MHFARTRLSFNFWMNYGCLGVLLFRANPTFHSFSANLCASAKLGKLRENKIWKVEYGFKLSILKTCKSSVKALSIEKIIATFMIRKGGTNAETRCTKKYTEDLKAIISRSLCGI